MIITLFLFSAFLGISRYFKLHEVLVGLVSQSPELYAGIALILIVIRVWIAINKYYPMVVAFVTSISNLSAKADAISRRFPFYEDRDPNKGSPFKGSKRPYSTKAVEAKRAPFGPRAGVPHLVGEVFPRVVNSTSIMKTSSKRPLLTPNKSSQAGKGAKNMSLYHSTLLRLNFKLDKIQDYLAVKGGTRVMPILKGLAIFTGTRNTVCVVRFLYSFVAKCHTLINNQGAKGLVKFLKAAGISLQQSLGGHLVRDVATLGARISRTKTGIPRFIPVVIRINIRRGDSAYIRLVQTLINIFRVIKFVGALKLDTITAASTATGLLTREIMGFIPLFLNLFVFNRFTRRQVTTLVYRFARGPILPLFKGGPGALGIKGYWNTHPIVMAKTLIGMMRLPRVWESFLGLVTLSHNFALAKLVDAFQPLRYLTGLLIAVPKGAKVVFQYLQIEPQRTIGKLGFKEEAAGKVRVFAMVDGWTQWVLKPYHETIFHILKNIKMDGTFNQIAPIYKLKPSRGLWSLDLSAATDRLPISIQRELLGALFGFEFAGYWANLLVGRFYSAVIEEKPLLLKYTVGQPMGALSSWASLAITHHFLVQVAAWKAGKPRDRLYTNYAVLGDDVVLGDKSVALKYLQIMESLGVGVNTSKSLLSPRGTALEFAKRTLVKGVDVSPVAFKEFYAASRNLGAFIQLVKKTKIGLAPALQAMGVGWQVRSWLNKPLGKLSARIRLLILAINIPTTAEEARSFFELGQCRFPRYRVDSTMVMAWFVEQEATRLFRVIHSLAPLSKGGELSSSWAAQLARTLALSDLGLGIPEGEKFPWEPWSWHSEWTEADLHLGTTSGVVRMMAVAFRKLILATREGMTLHWQRDLNRLAKTVWELMHLDIEASKKDFANIYISFIEAQRELAAYSRVVLAEARPNPPEDHGIMDPLQVRLWKRYSALLQGSKVLDNQVEDLMEQFLEKVVDKANAKLAKTPAKADEIVPLTPEIDPIEDAVMAYKFFCKAQFHEGHYDPWAPISNLGPTHSYSWKRLFKLILEALIHI